MSLSQPKISLFRTALTFLWVGVAVLLWVTPSSADDDYSAGLRAYIAGDYELAQSMWLKSAKNNNHRAMFNLGLLHDQEKLKSSDPEKAARWFRLAGQDGYAAADYHYANRLLEQGAEQEQVVRHLRRAAKNGSYPAQQKLKKMGRGELVAGVDNKIATPNAVAVENNAGALQPRQHLTEDWIKTREANDWTIQILAFQNEDKVKEFIDLHGLHSNAAYFIERSADQVLYKLVLGDFKNKAAAAAARDNLSPVLQQHGPWLRKFSSVQQIIQQQ